MFNCKANRILNKIRRIQNQEFKRAIKIGHHALGPHRQVKGTVLGMSVSGRNFLMMIVYK